MMLECKTYTYAEFSALFNTRDNQGIKRRLDHGVSNTQPQDVGQV